MIEGISAVTLNTHEMPRAVRFYRALGFEVLHGGEESSFTSFRAGASYLNLIAQPAEQRWFWCLAGQCSSSAFGSRPLLERLRVLQVLLKRRQRRLCVLPDGILLP